MPSPRLLQNRGRATLAIVALAIAIAVDGVHGAFYAKLLSDWGTIEDGDAYQRVEQALLLGGLAAQLFAGITFLAWFRRAYGNAHAVGLRGRFPLFWSIGSWFVPLLNLVRPAQIMHEMWRDAGPARVGTTAIPSLWWTCWLLHSFGAGIGSRMTSGHESNVRTGIQIEIAADLLGGIAGLLLITIVRRLTAAHEAMDSVQRAKVFDAVES